MKNKTETENLSQHELSEQLPSEIGISSYLSVVWKHLTPSVCQEVFEITRDRERQRKWGLYTLLRLWVGLLQTDLKSQTQAVESFCGKGHPLFPDVNASPESFFVRIQTLRPLFFRNLFDRFTEAISAEFPGNFEEDLKVPRHFQHVYSVDASRLERVEKRLKIIRNLPNAIIPGSLEAVYDIKNGYLRAFYFDPDGDRGESLMLDKVLPRIEPKSLILTDGIYCFPKIWRKVSAVGIYMISRYNACVGKEKLKSFSRTHLGKSVLDDWLVQMGGSQHGENPVVLRMIRLRTGKKTFTLITNVLDPKMLSPQKILALYRKRWTIERMYFHLKEVLALNQMFNSSPAAIGQQAYATAILYNALRLSQAKIAKRLKIPPEVISPGKLFPRIAEIMVRLTLAELGAEMMYEKICVKNPRFKVDKPNIEWDQYNFFRLSLKGIWVEKRNPFRKRRKYTKRESKKWTSFKLIRGGHAYLLN